MFWGKLISIGTKCQKLYIFLKKILKKTRNFLFIVLKSLLKMFGVCWTEHYEI